MSELRAMSELGLEYLEAYPPFLHADPFVRAIVDVQARELARAEQRLEELALEFFPDTADQLLPLWERMLGLSVNPRTSTDTELPKEQRRLRARAFYGLVSYDGSGLAFHEALSLTQNAYEYAEHEEGDSGSPIDGVVRLTLPYAPDSPEAAYVIRVARAFLPAHIGISVDYGEGFLVNVSAVGDDQI